MAALKAVPVRCYGHPWEKDLSRLSRGMTTGKIPGEKLGKQKPGKKEQVDCQAEDVAGGARAGTKV